MPVELSDAELDDFGDTEYIRYRIEHELNVQFNTRKQLVLKAIYAYITKSSNLSSADSFSMFGTNSFNLVWEKICAEVMDNQLQNSLASLKLPIRLNSSYKETDTLISLIEKPKWIGSKTDGSLFSKIAKDTLKPDLISIYMRDGACEFVIFDAKYHVIQLEPNKELRGQPGIGDIIKQYLYQLAYKKFIDLHHIDEVKNCFLMPTESLDIIDKGYANIEMLDDLDLRHIQIRQLPASEMYKHYLNGEKMDISKLNL